MGDADSAKSVRTDTSFSPPTYRALNIQGFKKLGWQTILDFISDLLI